VAALIAGSLFSDARLHALDAGVLGASAGRSIDTRAVVLEPLLERTFGPAVARVRLLDGLGAGEQAVLHVRKFAYRAAPESGSGWPEVGDVVSITGTVVPLGFADAYQRRRNAHAAIEARRMVATGARRGGVAGVLDGVRRRAEGGLAQGLARS
jgi:competence protein ComEC